MAITSVAQAQYLIVTSVTFKANHSVISLNLVNWLKITLTNIKFTSAFNQQRNKRKNTINLIYIATKNNLVFYKINIY